MKFGPFPQQELPLIEEVLKRTGLRYSVHAEAALVEIEDEDVDKLDPELEKLGFALNLPVPDFHNTDFVCPKCEQSQEQPGQCPRDGEKLLEFSEYAELQRKAKAPDSTSFLVAVVLALVVGLVAFFWSKG